MTFLSPQQDWKLHNLDWVWFPGASLSSRALSSPSNHSTHICSTINSHGASQVALAVKNLPANSGDLRDVSLIPELGRPPLEEGMATHSSILAWRISRTEEPGRLQTIGSQRVRCDWVGCDLGTKQQKMAGRAGAWWTKNHLPDLNSVSFSKSHCNLFYKHLQELFSFCFRGKQKTSGRKILFEEV